MNQSDRRSKTLRKPQIDEMELAEVTPRNHDIVRGNTAEADYGEMQKAIGGE